MEALLQRPEPGMQEPVPPPRAAAAFAVAAAAAARVGKGTRTG